MTRLATDVLRLAATRDRRARALLRASAALSSPRLAHPATRTIARTVEGQRARLAGDTTLLREIDEDITVAEKALNTSKGPRWVRFLAELTRHLAPGSVLELGTSAGISGSAFALALPPGGELTTIEGREGIAAAAARTFADAGVADRVVQHTGWFDDVLESAASDAAPIDLVFVDGNHDEVATPAYLEALLPHLAADALVLFDDIHWSDGMERAWARIAAHERCAFSVDLHQVGAWALGPGH